MSYLYRDTVQKIVFELSQMREDINNDIDLNNVIKEKIEEKLVSYHACKTIAKQALGEEVRERVFFRKDGVLFTNFGRTEINGQNVKEILKGGG